MSRRTARRTAVTWRWQVFSRAGYLLPVRGVLSASAGFVVVPACQQEKVRKAFSGSDGHLAGLPLWRHRACAATANYRMDSVCSNVSSGSRWSACRTAVTWRWQVFPRAGCLFPVRGVLSASTGLFPVPAQSPHRAAALAAQAQPVQVRKYRSIPGETLILRVL